MLKAELGSVGNVVVTCVVPSGVTKLLVDSTSAVVVDSTVVGMAIEVVPMAVLYSDAIIDMFKIYENANECFHKELALMWYKVKYVLVCSDICSVIASVVVATVLSWVEIASVVDGMDVGTFVDCEVVSVVTKLAVESTSVTVVVISTVVEVSMEVVSIAKFIKNKISLNVSCYYLCYDNNSLE